MKTFLLVALLLAMAVAAGFGLVFPHSARGTAPSATLVHRCDPPAVPEGVATLITCSFEATNTGTEDIRDAHIGLLPSASVPAPDRYYFFAARLDGVAFEVSGGQLSYALGDLPAGSRRVLELDVIVRSSARSGADAILYTDGTDPPLARVTVAGGTTDAQPGIELSLETAPIPLAPSLFDATVRVSNRSEYITLLTADVGLDRGFSVPEMYRRAPDVPPYEQVPEIPGRFPLITMQVEPYIAPGDEEFLTFDIEAAPGACSTTVAIVAYAATADGRVLRPALLEYLERPECAVGVVVGDEEVAALPRSGSGPPGSRATAPSLLAACGMACLAAGLALRRPPCPSAGGLPRH